MNIAALNRHMYSIAEAACLLRNNATTLRRWLDGSGHHLPVIRPKATGSEVVRPGLCKRWVLSQRHGVGGANPSGRKGVTSGHRP